VKSGKSEKSGSPKEGEDYQACAKLSHPVQRLPDFTDFRTFGLKSLSSFKNGQICLVSQNNSWLHQLPCFEAKPWLFGRVNG